ncbi:sodium/glucose cotransporter [Planctomycetales bacterium]|nr:sodium/glucose cotransporter [Planctomycetales bacterium]
MSLHLIDIIVIAAYFVLVLGIGWVSAKKAGKNTSEFFLSGRNAPWWLLGFSLVATTFAADTPNLVTDIVRKNGVAGNWVWWAFLLTGMTTVFIYAKLWRRLGVMTDIEFYEVRYGGKSGAFLRGFRTLYVGLLINTIIMANVTLAIVKILGVMIGAPPWVTISTACTITTLYAMFGGFTAVLWVDFVLFLIAMSGAVLAAVCVVNGANIGTLHDILTHPNVVDKLSFFPDFSDANAVITLLVVPLCVMWWSAWYPGAEPGGGSYTAQHMLSAKNENHALGAVLFFNFCHYAIRPFPWIVVALCSLIVFPDIASLQKAFPALPAPMINDDMAYPAMLRFLPHGFFGFVLASLFAAFMSTVATHLNLGSSYMVNDFHRRFLHPKATEKECVLMGRIWTAVLMALAVCVMFFLKSALDGFQILIMVGSGTGLLFLLRWFWLRINAYSEMAAMIFALIFAMYFKFWHADTAVSLIGQTAREQYPWLFADWFSLITSVALTTIGWITVTLLTPPESEKTLQGFVSRTRCNETNIGKGIVCAAIGCVAIYAGLLCVGSFIYGNFTMAFILLGTAIFGGTLLLIIVPERKKNTEQK